MKKLFGLLPICFVLLAIISCSGLNESSSLSLTFNGSDFVQNTSARNISVSSEYEGYYIVASVLGDYTETKSLQITSGGTYTIEFNSVPVGANIYVEANVYNPNCNEEYNYCHIFTGTSAKQKVSAGENNVNLVMKNLVKEDDLNEYDSMRGSYLFNEDSIDVEFRKYPNGKYQIKSDGTDTILSEGLLTGGSGFEYNSDTGVGTEFTINEYIYSYWNSEENGASVFSGHTILDNYNSQSVTTGEMNSFNFNSKNGLTYRFTNT